MISSSGTVHIGDSALLGVSVGDTAGLGLAGDVMTMVDHDLDRLRHFLDHCHRPSATSGDIARLATGPAG
jgi:hypothetical protein